MASSVETFRRLHESGCFVIPNPWDVGSARLLASMGFKALASTSAGFAFSRGLPDEVTALDVEEVLEHVRELAAATPLPLNADFQAGFGADADTVAANVARCVATGVAGLSIEDATGAMANPLYERTEAIARFAAARKAVDASGSRVVLTARCEAVLLGVPDAFRIAVDRLVAFADAGADCLFAPGLREPAQIEALVKAVAPKPLNVLVSSASTGLTVARLADLGVRRISLGSALSRVAWGGFIRAAKSIAETGTFDSLCEAATFAELNAVFRS